MKFRPVISPCTKLTSPLISRRRGYTYGPSGCHPGGVIDKVTAPSQRRHAPRHPPPAGSRRPAVPSAPHRGWDQGCPTVQERAETGQAQTERTETGHETGDGTGFSILHLPFLYSCIGKPVNPFLFPSPFFNYPLLSIFLSSVVFLCLCSVAFSTERDGNGRRRVRVSVHSTHYTRRPSGLVRPLPPYRAACLSLSTSSRQPEPLTHQAAEGAPHGHGRDSLSADGREEANQNQLQPGQRSRISSEPLTVTAETASQQTTGRRQTKTSCSPVSVPASRQSPSRSRQRQTLSRRPGGGKPKPAAARSAIRHLVGTPADPTAEIPYKECTISAAAARRLGRQ